MFSSFLLLMSQKIFCHFYHEENSEESQCIQDSSIGYCIGPSCGQWLGLEKK